MRLDRHSSAGYVVNHMARLFARALQRRIAEYGVVPGQFAQLLALYENDGLTQSELCALVRIEQPTMARTLQRMERDGLIRRRRDADDLRRTRVFLTPKARRLEGALANCAREVNRVALSGLRDRDVTAFMRMIADVISKLEQDEADAYERGAQ